MNDRLADLGGDVPSWAMEDGGGGTSGGFGGGDIEMQPTNGHGSGSAPASQFSNPFGGGGADDFDDFESAPELADEQQNLNAANQTVIMDNFFKDVDSINADIDAVTTATKRISDIDEKAKLTTHEAEENKLSAEIRPLISSTNKKAKTTKALLTVLKTENERFKEDESISNADLRKRENLVNTLTRKFIDEMKQYQSVQQTYKTNIKKKAEQQILYVKEDATPEEIDQIMKSDGGRESLLQTKVLQGVGGVNESIKQTYTKVAGKYQDVLILEQSVAELHQMFLDFALLTEQQGDLIDQIEFNVKGAADYVEDANVEVFHAIEYSKKIRKKQCCIIIIVICVGVGLLFAFGIIP
jgi:t-SNARE complex subunit (syntaxin)